ncbi:MAG: acetyl-CoA carboxylase biotin carboxyl carrier protein [Saprospiraceae bacterium]|nr:MAG: acetyl-CoA carboxylase, biotin carboxyl carrier protein [Bacteroidetes bacterium OLB9]MCO6462933.1 acetyl-CoA carboxylase biotin carboxyl carrier protein [Saprospiraceae bacterium]MCZ2337499.1 acetyl-CoA carboxylase biotin carboxyl carrier protein [Chitinophagales bacterium]
MTFHEVQELIKLISKSNLTEFKMKEDDFEISIRTDKFQKGSNVQTVVAMPQAGMPAIPAVAPIAPAAPAAPATPASKPVAEDAPSAPAGKNLVEIKSPIVGTFYRASGPDKPPFVKVGDTIKQGDVVCIIEAMKLFNEIESEVSGTVVKVLVEDASPVEYDQVLFLVEA